MESSKNGPRSNFEDYVEYSIYPVDCDLPEEQTKQQLIDLKTKCLTSISTYIIQYMWHQAPFSLIIKEDHLYGRVEITDNIEDEWYVISLLFKLTELHPDITVNVMDQDGEVLLIEAADQLPTWAQDPETCNNRVYIHRNELHLIPIAQDPSQLTPIPAGVPSIKDAINTVYRYPDATRASKKIQSVIKERMKSYPESWSDQKQYLHVIVPEKVKSLLHVLPNYLISAAIRCFCTRDSIDIRKCRIMKRFPGENLVKTGLTISKCLYAMLVKQEFRPDKKMNWQIPRATHDDFKAADLGFKLTCGLEILYSQSKITNNESGRLDSDIDEFKYQQYEKSLLANGYFQNELRGSKNWNILSIQAKEYFYSTLQTKNLGSEELSGENYSAQLAKIMGRVENEASQNTENNYLPNYEDLSKMPDDDSWLDYEPDSFDEMLKNHFKINETSSSSKISSNEKSIPSELKSFLSCVSNFDGVDSLPKDNDDTDHKMNFDAKEFENVVREMAKVTDSNYYSDSSDSEISEEVDLNSDNKVNDVGWASYCDQMKNELEESKVMSASANEDPIESLADLERPVNIDMGVVKNMLQSYKNENGMPGPATTLLTSLGLAIDPEA